MQGIWVKHLRKGEEDDQADFFNIVQNRPNTGVHLEVDVFRVF